MTFAKKYAAFFLGLLAACPLTYAGMVERFLQKAQEEKTPLMTEKTIQLAYFTQLIDHNNPALGVFSQRYYIDETYGSKNDSPVFFTFAVNLPVVNAY